MVVNSRCSVFRRYYPVWILTAFHTAVLVGLPLLQVPKKPRRPHCTPGSRSALESFHIINRYSMQSSYHIIAYCGGCRSSYLKPRTWEAKGSQISVSLGPACSTECIPDHQGYNEGLYQERKKERKRIKTITKLKAEFPIRIRQRCEWFLRGKIG